MPFDLAVVVPLHGGADYVGRSPGLGDELELRADRRAHAAVEGGARTSSSSATRPTCPASKAGSVTHFEGEVLVENVRRFLAGEPLDATYDGHANCFIETGFHKALLIDFNYDTEPLPGHFPAAVGLPLLKESRLNHLGKLMFQWFYWHAPAARTRHPRHRLGHADRRQGPPHRAVRRAGEPSTTRGVRHDHQPPSPAIAVELERRGLLRATPSSGPTTWPRPSPRREGIDPLTDRHWQVIRFMRKAYERERHRARPSACSARPRASRSRSSTSSSRRARRRSPPRSPASPSPAAASDPDVPPAHPKQPAMRREPTMGDTIEKVSIIISKGSLEGVYPGLIMANGARAEGIEANLFFTFFGLDAIHAKRVDHIKVATVGNPGMHMATLVGALPGMSGIATHMLEKKMDELDIPPIHEFIEMIADTGAGLYACKASVDLFGFEKNDFMPQIEDIITVGEFYEKAAGGQIIFT